MTDLATLDALQAEAAADQPPAAPGPDKMSAALSGEPPGEPVKQRVDVSTEFAGLLELLAGIIAPMMPRTAALYTPAVCAKVGQAVDKVCAKHGWLHEGLGETWGPELGLALTVVPLGIATYKTAQLDLAALNAPAPAAPAPAAA